MALALGTSFLAHERTIHNTRAQMLAAYIEQIRGLDEHGEWALLVGKAREAGLEKEDLCRELSCAWSTVTRWVAGQTAPGPFARAGIKEKLLDMIGDMQRRELSLAQAPDHSLAQTLEYA